MAIKLIVSDVDGTLMDHGGNCHQRTRQAIRRAVDEGILVTLGTGRGYGTARPIHKELGMNAPLITLNGAVIRDPFFIFQSHLVTDEAVAESIPFSMEAGLHVYYFVNEQIYTFARHRKVLQAYFGSIESAQNELDYFHWIDGEEALLAEILGRTNKIVFASMGSTPAQQIARLKTARETLERRIQSGEVSWDVDVTSSYYNNMELMPKGVNKGTGVAELAEALSIEAHEVMCVGDNENDVDMFAYAGESFAMANASDAVKARAKHVTLPVNEGGVGAAIEKVLEWAEIG